MNSRTMLIVSCFILFTVLVDKSVAEKKVIPKIYEEIGCTEITDANGPTRFQCPDFSTYANDKCYLKGKVFDVGSDIDEDLWPSCQPACRCNKRGGLAEIVCAHNDCPEFLGARLIDSSCVQRYENIKDCCLSAPLCDRAKISQLNKCVVDGKEYRPGEKIYPKDSCYHCLCAEGYNNQLPFAENPHCEKIDCHMELNHWLDIKSGCVPIYTDTPSCCPWNFKCPAEGDEVVPGTASEFSNDEKYSCKFGNLIIQHGKQLKTNDKCLKCECSTPPYITCVKKSEC